jgi:rhodanese-related sulfurtransferase
MEFIQQHLQNIIIVGVLILFFGWRSLRFRAIKQQLPGLLAQGAQLIDVRSAGEFAAGHNQKARNIPLSDLQGRVKTLDPKKPVVVCCASGTRSGMAMGMLKKAGFQTVINAGPWQNTL